MKRAFTFLWVLMGAMAAHGQPNSRKNLADSLLAQANAQLRTNAYVAQPILQRVLQMADSLQDAYLKAEVLNTLGVMYTQQEEYSQSQEALQQAEALLKTLPAADTLLIDTYTNLGILHERTQKYQVAIGFYNQVQQLLSRIKAGPLEQARNLTNIGHVLEEQGQLTQAASYYQQALELCTKNQIAYGQALLHQNLANLNNGLKLWSKSLWHSQQSLQMARAHGLPRIVAAAYQNMGATYLQQQQYSQALPYYQQAFDSAHAIGYTKALLDAALQLSVCYQKTGQPLEALARFQQYAHLKDSIFSAEKTQRIEALQAAYENQRKEDEIERLQVQQQLATARQQRTYVAIVGLVLVLAATGLLLSQRLRRRRAEMEAEKMQLLSKANEEKRQLDLARMNSELSALKAQMNPHFLFNALNSVQDLFLTGNTQAANELLAKFSDLTRAVLDASGQRTIPLYEEIEILKNYLEIEKTRFADTLNYTFDVDPQIDLYQTEIPPMLVQPYVENAIKHGLLHLTANRKLQVLFTQEAPGQLLVTIEDNGVGRQQAARYNQMRQKKHQSFATSATEKRLQLLNSGRQQQIGVRYTDLAKANGSPAGTRVTLRIPIEGAADKE